MEDSTLTLVQARIISERLEADIESVQFCEKPHVAIVVRENGRTPRALTMWTLPDHSSTAVPEYETGILVNPEVRSGFYGGEVTVGNERMRIALAFTATSVIPYFECNRTADPKAIDKWQAGDPVSIWGPVSNIQVKECADNGQVCFTTGSLVERFNYGYSRGRLGLTRLASPNPAVA